MPSTRFTNNMLSQNSLKILPSTKIIGLEPIMEDEAGFTLN